jgi:hypothetical protein
VVGSRRPSGARGWFWPMRTHGSRHGQRFWRRSAAWFVAPPGRGFQDVGSGGKRMGIRGGGGFSPPLRGSWMVLADANPWLAPWATVLAPRRGLVCGPSGARMVVALDGINRDWSGSWRRLEPLQEQAARPASRVECGSGRVGVRGHDRDTWDVWNGTWAFSCGAEPIGWLHGISPARAIEEVRPRTTSPRSGLVQPSRRANRRQPPRSS